MLSHQIKLFVITALLTFAVTSQAKTDRSTQVDLRADDRGVTSSKLSVSGKRQSNNQKMIEEPELSGSHNYVIRLQDRPVASYRGGIAGLEATAPNYAGDFNERVNAATGKSSSKKRASLKLDMNSRAVKDYQKYLNTKQSEFLTKSAQIMGSRAEPVTQLNVAFNGVVVNLTQSQAKKIAAMPEVSFVERERFIQLDTDRGPELIGAPQVWSGTASGSPHYGEGVIVGIIDSGINSDHPSFAETAADGYVHTNPWGDGVYIGDCVNGFPEMCNNKLIGVRSYAAVTNIYQDSDVFGDTPPPANGEDYDGHGTHVAGTAAGNLLFNVPLLRSPLNLLESDGYRTSDFEFPQISGVAHRANVVAYQVCRPGRSGDTYSGCSNAVMLNAIEDAIVDGVDVINMSISGGGNPWNYFIAEAFLNAQEAGIFVAISAGNSGPDDGSTEKNAPWYSSIAASSHGRGIAYSNNKTIGSFSGGDTAAPGTISGSGRTLGLSAPIVYAGDFDNPNDDPTDDSAQCLAPFPEGTFSGQIVVCDRGAIARVEKAENVAAGGAGGYVLANVNATGDGSNLVDDTYVVPGIQINATDGNALKTWLASGSGHTATISTTTASTSIGSFDDVADFSSRGPNNTVPDVMMPTMTAPGEAIYAAFADQQFGHDVSAPTATDYRFLQGTSMSSPHAAGAGALIKSVHPSWSPDNIRSALMMTAERDMTIFNGADSADIFDMGSGRIQVDLAVKTGLVMEETSANYLAANPDTGGDPKTLNIPSMGNTRCLFTCSWTRTVTATRDATWNITTRSDTTGVTFSVNPSSFTIAENESRTIEITATSSGVSDGTQAIGYINLTSSNTDIPDLHMPAFVTIKNSTLPDLIARDIDANSGSFLFENLQSAAVTDLSANVLGLQRATIATVNLPQDSDNSSPFDSTTDGVRIFTVSITENSPLLWVELIEGTAQDFDLYIGRDSNSNGVFDEDDVICESTSPTSDELCQSLNLAAGDYWILVQNWRASATGATDSVILRYAAVPVNDLNNLSISPVQNIPQGQPYNVQFNWSDDMSIGELFIGIVELASDANAESEGNLGNTIIALNRVEGAGDVSDITLQPPGPLSTSEDTSITLTINYTDANTVANTLTVTADSGTLSGQSGSESGSTIELTPDADFNGVIAVTATVTDNEDSSDSASITFNVTVTPVNDAPSVTANATQSTSGSNTTITLISTANDVDNDPLVYSWTQTAGPSIGIANANQRNASVGNAPAGSYTFQVTVSDGELSDSATTSITVAAAPPPPPPAPPPTNSGGGGGSMGLLMLLMLSLFLAGRQYTSATIVKRTSL